MSKILVVEDEADSREALRQFLVRQQHDVECASNGSVALDSIIKSKPELVVLDLSMPEVDGMTLLGIVRAYLRFQSLPVVVWTGVEDQSLHGKVKDLGVNAVVMKGQSSYNEILTEIARALPA